MMTSRCPNENELVLLADGALADGRRRSIDRHLDGCTPCTLLVAELAGMAAPQRPVPNRYKIVRQIGAGATGVVWEAEDRHLGRHVALKFVRTSGDTEVERRTRLFREARALAQLRHPNVVTVYDVGESGDELFLALELVIGTDARSWRTVRSRSFDDILHVWKQVAAGLVAVHRANIVHRDVKPDNVLVAEDGRVLLGDFGLACGRENQPPTDSAILGTPMYMAYEQLRGAPATHKSDQYALCVAIWEALTGTLPFTGPTLNAVGIAMRGRPRIPTHHREIFRVLARGLDPDPAKRWRSVEVMLAALDGRARDKRPRQRMRALWLAVGAAGAAAATTAGVLAMTDATARAGSSVRDDATSRFDASKFATDVTLATTPTERAPIATAVPTSASTSNAPTSNAPIATAVPTSASTSNAPTSASTSNAPTSNAAPHTAPLGRVDSPRELTAGEFAIVLDRATDKLANGDAQACITLLSGPPGPRAMIEQAESLRASCLMKSGDCEAGRALYQQIGHDWQPAVLAETIRAADNAYCPLDAGPRSRWAERARYRLVVAKGPAACRPIVAFVEKHAIALDRDGQRLLQNCK